MRAILIRDLRLSFRAGGGFGLALVFFLILIVLTPFAVGNDPVVLSKVSIGVIWIGALLACLLSLDRLFAHDFEDGTLEALVVSPLPLEMVVLIKVIVHWLTTGLPLAVLAPIFGAMLGLPAQAGLMIAVTLSIGTLGLSAIGGFGSALTVGVKRGGLLLSLLVLPMYVPTLIFGAMAARQTASGGDPTIALTILGAITLTGIATLPFVAAMVLRMNVR